MIASLDYAVESLQQLAFHIYCLDHGKSETA